MSVHYLRAPGKTMWLGEYVVLDGAPALVAAVDRHAVCTIESRFAVRTDPSMEVQTTLTDARWLLRDQAGQTHPAPDDTFRLLEAVLETLKEDEIPLPTKGAAYRFSTNALNAATKIGLGSSAAVAALGVVAFGGELGQTLQNADEVYRLALAAHHRFQGGVGSGSDVAAACYGGLLRMEKGQAPRRLDCALPHVLVIYTGFEANTRTFVRRVRAQSDQPAVRDALSTMRDLAIQGASALEEADLPSFLRSVRAFHRAEVALTKASGVPVVTSEIAQAVALLEQCGGAAKASGAGGGDIVIGFFATAAEREMAISMAVQAGLDVIPLAVEARGVLESLISEPTPRA